MLRATTDADAAPCCVLTDDQSRGHRDAGEHGHGQDGSVSNSAVKGSLIQRLTGSVDPRSFAGRSVLFVDTLGDSTNIPQVIEQLHLKPIVIPNVEAVWSTPKSADTKLPFDTVIVDNLKDVRTPFSSRLHLVDSPSPSLPVSRPKSCARSSTCATSPSSCSLRCVPLE
jgi:hypothetical protein